MLCGKLNDADVMSTAKLDSECKCHESWMCLSLWPRKLLFRTQNRFQALLL